MTFLGLSPWAVAGLIALATGALFFLHFLRVRPQVTRVPTLLFWREAAEETRARSLFDRFRHPRTFLLLVIAAALLLFALADPQSGSAKESVRHYAILIDTSPALGVALPSETSDSTGDANVHATVRASARALLDTIPLRDRVAIFAPDLIAGFDDPRPLAEARIDVLRPGATADWGLLFERARSLLADRTRPRVLVLSGPDAPKLGPTGDLQVRVARHGWRPNDRGLGAVGFGDSLTVRVESNAAGPARTLVARDAAGKTLQSVTIPAATGAERAWIAVPGIPADGTAVTLTLEPADRFAGNDTVTYRRPRRGKFRVHVAFDAPMADALIEADPQLVAVADAKSADLVLAAGAPGVSIPTGTVLITERTDRVADAAPPSALPTTLGPHPTIASRGGASVWLTAGGAPVAQHVGAGADGDVAVLEVAPFLFDPSERFCRSAAGAAWLTDAIRRGAGERAGQITVPPATAVSIIDGAGTASGAAALVDDALSPAGDPAGDPAADAGIVAMHAGGALPTPIAMVDDPAPKTGGGGWRTWEWLVLLGLLAASVDLWLQLRGRIP